MWERRIHPRLTAALADTPVVFLGGARQVGKSTLAASLTPARPVITFDDPTALAAARRDPVGFLSGLSGPVVLDEIQRVPELFLPLKASIDRDRRPGRFLLTGSAHVSVVPALSDALVGRMERLTLSPLSQLELERRAGSVIDRLYDGEAFATPAPLAPDDLLRRVCTGGFPEANTRSEPVRREAFFANYADTIVQRDVRELSDVAGLHELPRLLRLLASRAASILNTADLSRVMGLPATSLRRYLSLLEATHLVELLPAWSPNLGRRLVKARKLHFVDTGLLTALGGLTPERLAGDRNLLGPVLELFVAQELRAQAGWSRTQAALHHFRTHAGQEVDLVLEDRQGRVVAIEVKAGATLGASDWSALEVLRNALGERFVAGVVVYTGASVLPLGDRLKALPIQSLWLG